MLATGYQKPEVNYFKYVDLFPKGFEVLAFHLPIRPHISYAAFEFQRPNLYLQNFSTEDWSVLMTNSSYQNAIGTVYVVILLLSQE